MSSIIYIYYRNLTQSTNNTDDKNKDAIMVQQMMQCAGKTDQYSITT